MAATYIYNLGRQFEQVAEHDADRIALWFNDNEHITYQALNQQANQIARWLLMQEVQRGDVVCISGRKTIFVYAAMLACLKIGAVYAIMDPDSPAERLRKILAACRPRLLLGEADFLLQTAAITQDLEIHTAEKNDLAVSEMDNTNLPQTTLVTGANPAYIMYTSGSTGFPKGAVMTHANVLNLVEWGREIYGIAPDDICTNVNPLYFDNSVFDFYATIFNGARLVPFTKEEVRDPLLLVEKIEASNCTQWFSVPSLLIFLQTMKATDGKFLRSIRRFIFGGEGYPKGKLEQFYETYKDTAEFHNVYGPTECTCICSSYQLSDADFEDLQGVPPLGEMAKNFDYLILNDKGLPVLPGEVGELCLLGPNVGRGYYNDPESTAASFVQVTTNRSYYEIMYLTGDLVRLDPADGKIYIHGRKDHQIKHMGYRIELAEIEAAMHCLDYVFEACALHTNIGFSRIIAVIASSHIFEDVQFRQDLRKIIPDYMIPSEIHYVPSLPKNSNGKVDRRTLEAQFCQSVR
jgi:D-alanine--poly(phosphoribitol) ligase subunit 1